MNLFEAALRHACAVPGAWRTTAVIPGHASSRGPGIQTHGTRSGFRVRGFASPRNDELSPLDPGFRGKVDGAVPADVVEMPVEEFSRRALAGAMQQFEEVVIGFHLARSGETGAER